MAQQSETPAPLGALSFPPRTQRAMAKIASLACDAVIFDLEDAVAPEAKAAARENLRSYFGAARRPGGPECVIRINPLASEWGAEDLLAGRALRARRASCCPRWTRRATSWKPATCSTTNDAPDELRLWAMIETPKAMLNIGAIAELGRDPAVAARLFRCRTPTIWSRKPASWRRRTAAISCPG